MRVITAKYAGRCDDCGGRIEIGDRIYWARGEPTRHSACPDVVEPERPWFHEDRLTGEYNAEYAAGVADYEREKFNRETFGEDYAAAEELAWMYRTGEGM